MKRFHDRPEINGKLATNNIKSKTHSCNESPCKRKKKSGRKQYTSDELNEMDLTTLRKIAKDNKVAGTQRRTIIPNLLKLYK